MDFTGKIVWVTGSSRGIGKACIEKFASLGATVVIHYRKEEKKAEELKKKIEEKYQVPTLLTRGDISKEEDVIRMVEEIKTAFGHIDILVNNAAISRDSYIEEKTKEEFREVLDVNVIGTFLVTKYVAENMISKGSGNIIFISSTNGIDTNNTWSLDYDASKAGVISMMRNFALHYAPTLRINSVAPGWVDTEDVLEMNPDTYQEEKEKCLLKRFAKPEEIASVVCFIASSEASYINNSVIRVDGGSI
ncbi:MAG: SDR family oxidoreductase [Bacilli bacterium]|nr:SDR family oxidoreductase [Bacilli bacterium]